MNNYFIKLTDAFITSGQPLSGKAKPISSGPALLPLRDIVRIESKSEQNVDIERSFQIVMAGDIYVQTDDPVEEKLSSNPNGLILG
ncbi:MAG: hypothetical protein ACJAZW_001712 [Maritalea sp.]|jgi:hypothetical protein